jgi:Mg2+ and Co2+ transporter CorA
MDVQTQDLLLKVVDFISKIEHGKIQTSRSVQIEAAQLNQDINDRLEQQRQSEEDADNAAACQ